MEELENVFQIKQTMVTNNRSCFTRRLMTIKLAESLRDLRGYAQDRKDPMQSPGPLREEAFFNIPDLPKSKNKPGHAPP